MLKLIIQNKSKELSSFHDVHQEFRVNTLCLIDFPPQLLYKKNEENESRPKEINTCILILLKTICQDHGDKYSTRLHEWSIGHEYGGHFGLIIGSIWIWFAFVYLYLRKL